MTWLRIGVQLVVAGTLLARLPIPVHSQDAVTPPIDPATAVLHGTIRDSKNQLASGAVVSLKALKDGQTRVVQTDSQGAYRFSELRNGTYSLRAEKRGSGSAAVSQLVLGPKETKQVDLTLLAQGANKTEAVGAQPAFFDEPSFTVAGVADGTYLGSHSSGGTLRSAETLAKATASLGQAPASSIRASPVAASERPLRDAAVREPDSFEANYNLGKFLVGDRRPQEGLPYLERAAKLDANKADLHRLLGEANEQLGNSLDAVHEFQRAAELDASETNLFNWGAELLVHRAVAPAVEVFAKGNRMFPASERMLMGLAAALYAHGDYNQAAKRFFEACDLNPREPGPYLFMAKVQSSEITGQEGFESRLARFAEMEPKSARAKYYYATNLWHRREEGEHSEAAKRVLALLEEAVQLDPNLGVAYLQLGIVHTDREEGAKALEAFRKAAEVSPELEQAHYRLARAYAAIEQMEDARREMAIFEEQSKRSSAEVERERSELQQFVIEMRGVEKKQP